MATEKVTAMILYVDLRCSCCYKKVKKVLCKFPQIRGQVFDEDKNRVMITVVCCDPEKIRDKLCCKGGKAIQSIEIVENKPQQPEKPPLKPIRIETPELPNRLPEVVPVPVKPATPNPVQPNLDPPKPETPKKPVLPASVCCQECYEGHGGGPCHYGYGRPVPPPPGPCYGYPYGGNRPFYCYVSRCDCGNRPCYCYVSRCDCGNRPCYCYVSRCDCISEENPQGCSIM